MQPQNPPVGTDAPFGGDPFPAPAIAKPGVTHEHRDLSHGYGMDFRPNMQICQPLSCNQGNIKKRPPGEHEAPGSLPYQGGPYQDSRFSECCQSYTAERIV